MAVERARREDSSNAVLTTASCIGSRNLLHANARVLIIATRSAWDKEGLEAELDPQHRPHRVELETASSLKATASPVKQARQGALQTIDMLQCDPLLRQKQGQFEGNLICPWSWGVALTNITRKQIQSVLREDVSERVLPGRLLVCQDEMLDAAPESFEESLRAMLEYRFKRSLTLADLNHIRWHLYPEIRIDSLEIFPRQKAPERVSVPDVVKAMVIHKEQPARGLGDGHRVIHGVGAPWKGAIP